MNSSAACRTPIRSEPAPDPLHGLERRDEAATASPSRCTRRVFDAHRAPSVRALSATGSRRSATPVCRTIESVSQRRAGVTRAARRDRPGDRSPSHSFQIGRRLGTGLAAQAGRGNFARFAQRGRELLRVPAVGRRGSAVPAPHQLACRLRLTRRTPTHSPTQHHRAFFTRNRDNCERARIRPDGPRATNRDALVSGARDCRRRRKPPARQIVATTPARLAPCGCDEHSVADSHLRRWRRATASRRVSPPGREWRAGAVRLT